MGAERMLTRSFTFLTLAALLAQAAVVAAQEPETEPPDAAVNPCAVSQNICDTVSGTYAAVFEFLDRRTADSLYGVVDAAMYPSPDTNAAFSFVRVTLEAVKNSPETTTQASGADPERVAPGAAVLVVVTDKVAVTGAEAYAFRDEVEALPVNTVSANGNAAWAQLPIDPLEPAKELVKEISSIDLKSLAPQPPTAPGAGPPALGPRLESGEGLRPLPPVASPVLLPAHEAMTTKDRDDLPAPVATPDATVENPPLAPLAQLINVFRQPNTALFVAAAAAMLSALLLLPPLYHRLHRHQLLEHPARSRLYELVAGRPGIHIEELARASGCSRSTAVYHLRLLSRNGYVLAVGSAKSVHYYPNNGHQDPGEREQRALLSSPRTRVIAQLIAGRPGIARNDLAAAVGVSASTLSWHLGRLLERQLVEDRLTMQGRTLHPSPGLAEMLRPWGEPAKPEAAPEAPVALLPA